MIRVLLVDDHELVRTGLRRLLTDARGIRVVAEAGSGEEALRLARRHELDVVLLDVNMPGMGGLETTRKLPRTSPDLRIIVVTVHAEQPYPKRLLEAGAAGYVTKGCGVDEMLTAIETVHNGGRYISADIAQRVALSLVPGGDQSPLDQLSHREMQVLLMFAQGQTAADISQVLGISRKTVSTYRHRLFSKLELGSDLELLHLALRHGLIDAQSSA